MAFADRGGHSGATALEHLEEAWGADDLASFDADAFYDYQTERPQARYQEGERVIDWPSVMVRRLHVPGSARDVLTLRASEPATRWRAFAEGVMEIMEAVGARDLWIAASYPGGVPHSRDVPIWLVASDDAIAGQLPVERIEPEYEGPVGLSSVLGILAQQAGYRTATIFAVTPFYAGSATNPEAVLTLVRALSKALDAPTPVGSLTDQIQTFQHGISEHMARSEQLRTLVGALEQQYDTAKASGLKPGAPVGPSGGLDEDGGETQPGMAHDDTNDDDEELPPADEILRGVEDFLRSGPR